MSTSGTVSRKHQSTCHYTFTFASMNEEKTLKDKRGNHVSMPSRSKHQVMVSRPQRKMGAQWYTERQSPRGLRCRKNPWKPRWNLPRRDYAGLDEEQVRVSGRNTVSTNKRSTSSQPVVFYARLPGQEDDTGGYGG